MARTIDITFSKEGKARIETSGFQGASCVDASKFIEEALGMRNVEEEKTAEYYQEPPQHVHEGLSSD